MGLLAWQSEVWQENEPRKGSLGVERGACCASAELLWWPDFVALGGDFRERKRGERFSTENSNNERKICRGCIWKCC
jgi:hypothetical protein